MDDLISREQAINTIVTDMVVDGWETMKSYEEGKRGKNAYLDGISDALAVLKDLPSAQPERKTGHWIKTARWGKVYYCDQCRNYLDFDGVNAGRGSTNFCPNCGADMRERKEE